MSTTKPYLIRAIYEWCVDNHYTPHITVSVNSNTHVPKEYVDNGEIILNISKNAVNDLVMSNDYIQLVARFNGPPRKMQIPMKAVKGIFAKEIHQGLTFALELEPGSESKQNTDQLISEPQKQKKSSAKKPHLQVIK